MVRQAKRWRARTPTAGGCLKPGALWADSSTKAARALVLPIRPTGDRLVQAPHELANVAQSLAAARHPLRIADKGRYRLIAGSRRSPVAVPV